MTPFALIYPHTHSLYVLYLMNNLAGQKLPITCIHNKITSRLFLLCCTVSVGRGPAGEWGYDHTIVQLWRCSFVLRATSVSSKNSAFHCLIMIAIAVVYNKGQSLSSPSCNHGSKISYQLFSAILSIGHGDCWPLTFEQAYIAVLPIDLTHLCGLNHWLLTDYGCIANISQLKHTHTHTHSHSIWV